MKRRVKIKVSKVPPRIKLISGLYIFYAVFLLISLFFTIAGYLQYDLGQFLDQIDHLHIDIRIVLGLLYVPLVAEFLGLMQSILIASIVIAIFAGLYFWTGLALLKGKNWARKMTVKLSVVGLISGLLLVLIGILRLVRWGEDDEGTFLILNAIGLIIPGLIFYYLKFSKEAKAFFS